MRERVPAKAIAIRKKEHDATPEYVFDGRPFGAILANELWHDLELFDIYLMVLLACSLPLLQTSTWPKQVEALADEVLVRSPIKIIAGKTRAQGHPFFAIYVYQQDGSCV